MLTAMSEPLNPGGDPAAAETLAEVIVDAPPHDASATGARRSLWRHSDYMKVWTAATISLMGSQVSQLAIPFIAAKLLGATAFEVAMLGAVEMAPFLLFALPAGAWLDRVRRRPVLIGGDVGRGLALLSIPLAYALGVLTVWQLYAVGFVAGTLTVLFDVADQSYLPALLERDELVEANAKLSLPQSSAQVVGPALAGGLIGIVSAPFAIIVDAISFLASGGLIALIRKPEPKPERTVDAAGAHRTIRAEMGDGLRYVFGNPYLRMTAGSTATCNLGTGIVFSIFAVFAYQELDLSPALVGAATGVGGLGVLVGALVSPALSARFGVGRAIVGSMALTGLAAAPVPLMTSDPAVAGAAIFTCTFLTGLTAVIYNVNQVSFRQAITPLGIQGRMNATMRFIVWGTIPLGAFMGGLLATFLPIRTTMWIGVGVAATAFLWLLLSPVRSLREIPTGEHATAPESRAEAGAEA